MKAVIYISSLLAVLSLAFWRVEANQTRAEVIRHFSLLDIARRASRSDTNATQPAGPSSIARATTPPG
jgi:hypothetical protein